MEDPEERVGWVDMGRFPADDPETAVEPAVLATLRAQLETVPDADGGWIAQWDAIVADAAAHPQDLEAGMHGDGWDDEQSFDELRATGDAVAGPDDVTVDDAGRPSDGGMFDHPAREAADVGGAVEPATEEGRSVNEMTVLIAPAANSVPPDTVIGTVHDADRDDNDIDILAHDALTPLDVASRNVSDMQHGEPGDLAAFVEPDAVHGGPPLFLEPHDLAGIEEQADDLLPTVFDTSLPSDRYAEEPRDLFDLEPVHESEPTDVVEFDEDLDLDAGFDDGGDLP